MSSLDVIDRDIISHLQYNGLKPYTDIAAAIGISEGSVRRRVKRLKKSGLLQIVGVVKPQSLGRKAASIIGVSVQAGKIETATKEIAQFPEVT